MGAHYSTDATFKSALQAQPDQAAERDQHARVDLLQMLIDSNAHEGYAGQLLKIIAVEAATTAYTHQSLDQIHHHGDHPDTRQMQPGAFKVSGSSGPLIPQ